MDVFANLATGFGVAVTPENLLFCLAGVLLGTLIGVLPGIGPLATVALLLPLTFQLEPVGALIMLAGIYYGAQYGGSTTAILVNLPGEASSVVTCLDGHALARQGRAGTALATAAIGSFIAGSVATVVIAVAGPLLGLIALSFGPAEYWALMALGLVGVVVLARGPVLKAMAMILVGLLVGLVGTDVTTGTARYTFGIPELVDGVGFAPVAMGLFGLAEVVINLEQGARRDLLTRRVAGLLPTRDDLRRALPAIFRGTTLGSLLGTLPGGGPVLSAFASYAMEKKLAAEPARFGNGAIEGVAGPESANNAAAQTSFIPLLTLGVPANPVMALMIGAMMIHGITPGPQVMTAQPELFWGIIASMWIGNALLLVFNLPLIGLWVRFLSTPYRLLFPMIVLFCSLGAFALNNSTFEVLVMAAAGLAGYAFRKLGCDTAPLLMAMVLGPMMEENFRRAMLLSQGRLAVFVERPISLGLLAIAVTLLLFVLVPAVRQSREEVFRE
jgi:putative tricarboxylic transport membrane protein